MTFSQDALDNLAEFAAHKAKVTHEICYALLHHGSAKDYAPVVVKLGVEGSVSGKEDWILRQLRKEGYYTNQVIWFDEDQYRSMFLPSAFVSSQSLPWLPYITWQTADGREVLVKDMTDDHITNIIHYLASRWARYRIESDPRLREEFINYAKLRNIDWESGPVPYQYPEGSPEYCKQFEIPPRS